MSLCSKKSGESKIFFQITLWLPKYLVSSFWKDFSIGHMVVDINGTEYSFFVVKKSLEVECRELMEWINRQKLQDCKRSNNIEPVQFDKEINNTGEVEGDLTDKIGTT